MDRERDLSHSNEINRQFKFELAYFKKHLLFIFLKILMTSRFCIGVQEIFLFTLSSLITFSTNINSSNAQQAPAYPQDPGPNFIRPEFDNQDSTPNTSPKANPTQSTVNPRSTRPQSIPATTAISKEVWELSGMPISGTPIPKLQVFDQAMVRFMKERNIKSATLAVMKDGRLLLAHGYGYSDPNQKTVTAPDTLMRIASVSKPITAAAVKQLIRQGKIRLDTKVFPLLGITPLGGSIADSRLNEITVQHLLEHRGGWDRGVAFDPMFRSVQIANALGKSSPASCPDVISYMMSQPLQYAPGKVEAYSNFGYCILGRVIEKVTGQSYESYIQKSLLAPLGINDIAVGYTLPQKRHPKEVGWYIDEENGSSVFDGQTVPYPDGAFYLEAMDAHGGLISSSISLVKFGQAYWISGEPRNAGESAGWTFFGSLPGTWSMLHQRPDGLNIAVLFNQRRDTNHPSGEEYGKIQDVMNTAADSLKY